MWPCVGFAHIAHAKLRNHVVRYFDLPMFSRDVVRRILRPYLHNDGDRFCHPCVADVAVEIGEEFHVGRQTTWSDAENESALGQVVKKSHLAGYHRWVPVR